MKRVIFTTCFVVCAAVPALSAELEFSGAGEVEYDDNVFRREHDRKDDVLFRLRPGLRIYEDRGDDLNFSVGYTAPVEFSTRFGSDFDEVDHVGDGRFTYHANDRFEIFAKEHYAYIRSTLREDATDPIVFAEGSPQFNDERDRIKLNDAALGATYSFSPRTTGRAIVSSNFFDSSRDDRARVWSVGGVADAQYRLTLRHQLGAGAGYTYQDFDDRLDIEGSQTQTYRLFGTWRWTISPTLAFDLNAGPAYLETQQDDAETLRQVTAVPFLLTEDGRLLIAEISSCGTIENRQVATACAYNRTATAAEVNQILSAAPITVINEDVAGESDSQVTGFVEAVLSQRWTPTLATALRYSRTQGDASGLGGTVIVDAVSLSNTWDFADRWQLALRGDYVRRESAFDIAQTFDAVFAGSGADPAGAATRRDPSGAPGTGRAFNATEEVEIDTDRWGVAGRITHRLFRNTSLYGQLRYDQQESRGDSLGRASDFENFLATFGVRHVFEPIPLW